MAMRPVRRGGGRKAPDAGDFVALDDEPVRIRRHYAGGGDPGQNTGGYCFRTDGRARAFRLVKADSNQIILAFLFKEKHVNRLIKIAAARRCWHSARRLRIGASQNEDGCEGRAMVQMKMVGAVRGMTVKGAPYSADEITETNQVLADGTRIHRESKVPYPAIARGAAPGNAG